MVGQTVYSSYECLDEVFLFKGNEHEFLFDIITKYSNVMIDIEDEEFEKLLKDNPFIKSLLKRPDKSIFPKKSFFDNIDAEDLSLYTRDIFFLNKPKSYCDSKAEKYGVLVLSTDNLSDVQVLAKRQYRSYEKGDIAETNENNNSSKGWQSFIGTFKIMPINSVVVIDNHIFNNSESGKNNLINLIEAILPQNLDTSFHILIVIEDNPRKYNKAKLEEITAKIKTELGKNIDYRIDVAIITHLKNQEFHNRFLISNYHIIESPYGFDCFDTDGKVKKSNEPKILSAYFTLKNKEGDPEIKSICRILGQVNKLVKYNKSLNPEIGFNMLVCDEDYSNRLLSGF
jgi:hypothetical protein